MPYFNWIGVNLKAKLQKGTLFATNLHELDTLLFAKEVALISCSTKIVWLKKAVSLDLKKNYFYHIGLLIKAGMLLPDALRLIASQTAQQSFAPYSYAIARKVNQGINFSTALSEYPQIFDPLMVTIVEVGQESGNLPAGLEIITTHLEYSAQFRKQLRAALMLPIITFGFFIIIICIMITVVVPHFAALFKSMHKELPLVTRIMIKMSNAAQPLTIVMSIIILTFLAAAYKKFAKSVRGRTFLDVICLRIPLIQQVVIYKNMTGFFHALALLIEGGMPLTKAIAIAKESIDNSRIKQKIGSFERDIRAGSSFAQIFADNDQWFGQDVVALIKVGQESGTLVQMLRHVAHRYQSKLLAVLNTLSSLFQPLLLLILGLLITCLIIALYTPIMNISSAV